jgi:Peptidase family M1 domain
MKKQTIFLSIILLIIIFATYQLINGNKNEGSRKVENVSEPNFSPVGLSPGNFSEYDIDLTMSPNGEFKVKSTVLIKNISKDSWDNLVFYFIPNMFTESVSPDLEFPAKVEFKEISIEGKEVNFSLKKDKLNINLENILKPNQDIKVDFLYNLTLPENGLRITKNNGNFYLSQFYPMVATYRNHNWNKEEYRERGETYHTAFSDFKVNYNIPEGYTLASSNDQEGYPSLSKGSFENKNVKEIFLAVLRNPQMVENPGEINVRVFGMEEEKRTLYKEISEEASNAIDYFQKNIGPYPFKQFDIILDSLGMEYPGIVTASTIYNSGPVNKDALKRMVVHEIAHQWFYGIISNDPYNEAWLDEGFADFATSLYFYSKSKQNIPYDSMYKQIESLDPLPINLPLDKYKSNVSSYVYGKSTVMLWSLFENNGGIKEAERFLNKYYLSYKYKEVNSKEFVRFTRYYFNLDDESAFKDWLLVK